MNIGTHIPTTWQGMWPTPYLRISEEVNPGIRGRVRLEDEWDIDNATVTTYKIADSESVKNVELENITAMQGYTFKVVDQFGINRGDCLVLRVSVDAIKLVTGKWEISATFTIAPEVIIPAKWKDQTA